MTAGANGSLSDSLREKLLGIAEKHRELTDRLADPVIAADAARYRECAQEAAEVEEVAEAFAAYEKILRQLSDTAEMCESDDPEMRDLADAECRDLAEKEAEAAEGLKRLLVPRDPHDNANVFLEIRAGAGGDEAAIFAGDLLRAYTRYAEARGWRMEEVTSSDSEKGGFREMVVQVTGRGVYARLKYEAGVHRVQRVPATEAQGRIHTSTCTVAVLPEVREADVDINPADLRIDYYRASGSGGQHVNKTSSAVRITHNPTGIVVQCQDERSQHKNKDRAMSMLRSRMVKAQEERLAAERSEQRRDMVGSGERSEKIRTYNYPQNRVTDHRIGLTLHKLDQIMDGHGFDEIVDALIAHDQAALLGEL